MAIHILREGIGSEKYKAAVEYGKACVVPAWVVESARKGVCEPLAKYRVAGASTSSPLAEHRLPDMSKYSKDRYECIINHYTVRQQVTHV